MNNLIYIFLALASTVGLTQAFAHSNAHKTKQCYVIRHEGMATSYYVSALILNKNGYGTDNVRIRSRLRFEQALKVLDTYDCKTNHIVDSEGAHETKKCIVKEHEGWGQSYYVYAEIPDKNAENGFKHVNITTRVRADSATQILNSEACKTTHIAPQTTRHL